jgi:GntR family colanic acid and biofilm gene transcriptional regulator
VITIIGDLALSSEVFDPAWQPPFDEGADGGQLNDDSLHDRAYEQIRSALMSGMLAPGTKVSIRKLATELGMSPMPVREALKRLISERCLEAKENRTTVVRILDTESFNQVTSIRKSLEGLATELATSNISDEDLLRLGSINEEMIHSALHLPDRYLHLNRQFHFYIYRLSKADILVSIIENLWVICGPMLTRITGKSGTRTGEKHHALLLAALSARNGAAARAAIEGDIGAGAARILQYFDDEKSQD